MRATKFVLAGLLATVLGGSAARAADPIVIGMFGPMTGERSALGIRFREAADMFTAEMNAKGGIAGRPIEIRVEDTRGTPRDAALIAQKFASDQAVLAVIGGQTSTESMAAAPILADAKLAQVAPTASHPDYTKISPYQFRTTATNPTMTEPHVDMLTQRMGMKKIALVYFNDDWGTIVSQLTAARLKEKGVPVVLTESMIPDSRDFRPLVTKIKSSGADGVFLISHYSESALFMQQLRQADPTIKVAGTDTLNDPQFIELAHGAAEGVVMPTPFLPESAAAAAFSKAYEAKFGKVPNYYSAFTYDALQVVGNAMQLLVAKGKPLSRQAIRDQIADAPPFAGVGGMIKYEGSGDLGSRSVEYIVVKGGTYQPAN